MQFALVFLGTLLAAFIVVLVLAFAMPLDVRFRLSRFTNLRFTVEARAFGGWGPWIKIAPAKANARKHEAKPKKRKRRSKPFKRSWSVAFAAAKRLLAELLGAISLHDFSVEAEFGTADPADTGAIFGMMAPLNYGLGGNIIVWPNFDGPCLTGRCTAVVRFKPFAVVMPFARFGWTLWGPAK